jgi:hypothetical protein
MKLALSLVFEYRTNPSLIWKVHNKLSLEVYGCFDDTFSDLWQVNTLVSPNNKIDHHDIIEIVLSGVKHPYSKIL